MASAEELHELGAWISLFKQHRGLLFGGDIVRLDFPDETLTAGGVVAADQRTALYYQVAAGRSEVVSLGRLRLPGLAPERRYRVMPVMIEYPPSGLRPPPWWGVHSVGQHDYGQLTAWRHARFVADGTVLGVELTGAALAQAGLTAAQIDPDHAVLYFAEAVD